MEHMRLGGFAVYDRCCSVVRDCMLQATRSGLQASSATTPYCSFVVYFVAVDCDFMVVPCVKLLLCPRLTSHFSYLSTLLTLCPLQMKCMARVEVCSQLMLRAFIEANARCV
jgi:hypothetical protein